MDEKYLPELMAEKDSLDPSFTHALRLVNQAFHPHDSHPDMGETCVRLTEILMG